MGSATCEGFDNSPSTTSRLISRPTSRKNTAISPSLIQWCSGPSAASKPARAGEFTSTMASTAAASNGSAEAASLSMKVLKRLDMYPHSKTPGRCVRAFA